MKRNQNFKIRSILKTINITYKLQCKDYYIFYIKVQLIMYVFKNVTLHYFGTRVGNAKNVLV